LMMSVQEIWRRGLYWTIFII